MKINHRKILASKNIKIKHRKINTSRQIKASINIKRSKKVIASENLYGYNDLVFPNGHPVDSEIDLVRAVMYMWGLDGNEARRELSANEFSQEDLQRAIDYWAQNDDDIESSTNVNASEDENYIVHVDIPTDPESIRRAEQRRIAREIADGEDAYDLEHGEGIYSSDSITASTLINNKKIQPGLQFNRDGHRMEVASRAGNTCIITEDWIAEDTGEPVHTSEKYIIAPDPGHGEFCYRPEDKEYAFNSSDPDGYSWWARLYATGADNYPWDWDNLDGSEEESADYIDEEDEYTPSSTRGDYSPSNPWDAPGMSMSDFI